VQICHLISMNSHTFSFEICFLFVPTKLKYLNIKKKKEKAKGSGENQVGDLESKIKNW